MMSLECQCDGINFKAFMKFRGTFFKFWLRPGLEIFKTKATKRPINFYLIFSKVAGCLHADFIKLNPFIDIFQEKVMNSISTNTYFCKRLFTECF